MNALTAHFDNIQAELDALRKLAASPFTEAPPAAAEKPATPKPLYAPPPPEIYLPAEADAEKVFGKADPAGPYLNWFNFPTDNIRLYSRHGDGLKDRDGDGRDEHRCHKKAKLLLENALAAVYHRLGKERFEAEGWHVYSGCFNYRQKRLGSSLSMHSLGIAIDLNDSENPLHSKTTSFSLEGVDIMEEYGWCWGPRAWGMPGYDADNLNLYVDPMHFQLAIPRLDSKSWYAVKGLPSHIRQWKPS